ncbi:MAG: HAD family hydrolase [Nitrospinae bacterium]|nr:HAD family hydrolase [Nitrospinota bacterium]
MQTTVKAVLFDIGSTLIEGPAISPSKKISALLVGDYSLKKEIAATIMTTNIKTVEELEVILNKKHGNSRDISSELKTIWKEQENSSEVKDGTMELWKKCRKLGLKTGLISNIWFPYYSSFVKVCPEIDQGVDVKLLSFERGFQKPDVRMFTQAVEELKLKPEEIVIVGDTYDCDIAPAIEAGIKTIWFLHRHENEKEALLSLEKGTAKKPDFTQETLRDITSLFENSFSTI